MTTPSPSDAPDLRAICPKCGAEQKSRYDFACGSIPPNDITPSFAQSDKCRIAELESELSRATVEARDLLINVLHACVNNTPDDAIDLIDAYLARLDQPQEKP